MHWLSALQALAPHGTPAILVTVAAVQGSGPREPGAKMVVTEVAQFDTIGGGHLEMRACEIARDMLAGGTPRRLERFPLGPSLGQCCGGVVQLAFERVGKPEHAAFSTLAGRWRAREDSWRLVPLDTPETFSLLDASGALQPGTRPLGFDDIERDAPCRLLKDGAGQRWLVDPCLAYRPHLILFGAGHVGAAIVQALAGLPCHVTWVDEREEEFPVTLPANVTVEATDTPEAVVASARDGASYLVMTHSHALDQALAEAILRRRGVAWFGLIGSKTKRMQFEHRLRERGIDSLRLQDMVCPIGLPGIAGKQPAVIAASVTAQLLMVWEAAASATERTQIEAHA
ncbi:xanthine dehydrogenase accessory protein XdhC [Noviherbaspirillum galbum]|uniref:Xanthine dehydrogenase accessory protein XdhC n=1 Tax=Noviherbaspirillum galbum TaxID=2709383 RepID=A0A6B3STS2_9BURK|nr:xanthine dehydrogenase accessory protein XdhC [Noviherbaspirillum galbum]NEX64400.1 xanthine dehydrogenase accessory protein XdhC [Noviherbaspirillum galbum]